MTNSRPYLSIIFPVYNAASFLEETLLRLDRYILELEFDRELIIVNDCSTDASGEIIERFAKGAHPYPVTYLENPRNMGKGHNVARGILAARGHYRIFTDCDLAYPPEEIGKILASLEKGFDVAVACRVDKDSRYTISPAFFHYLYTRHTASRILNFVLRKFLLPLCRDSQAGLKGFTAEAAKEIFTRQKIFGFSFDMEALYLADRMGYLVEEVPVNFAYFDEPTTIKFAEDTMKVLTDIFRIKWYGWRNAYRLPEEAEGRKELIVVADDFGFTKEISRGIIDTYKHGIVRSISVMTNSAHFEGSMALLDPIDDFDIGLHFTLTAGRPLCPPDEVPSLVDRNGNFHSIRDFYLRVLTRRIKYDDVYRELTAQFIKLKERVKNITHINSHHHVHALPVISAAVAYLARSNKIRYVRAVNCGFGGSTFKTALKKWLLGRFDGSFREFWHRKGIHTAQNFAGFELTGNEGLLKRWQDFLMDLPFGTTEVMTHPGYLSDDLDDTYLKGREIELKVLKDPSLLNILESKKILLKGLSVSS